MSTTATTPLLLSPSLQLIQLQTTVDHYWGWVKTGDIVWNTSLAIVVIVVLQLSNSETPDVPLKLWVFVYFVQKIIHLLCTLMSRIDNSNCIPQFLNAINVLFYFVWFIAGLYWVSEGGTSLGNDAPKLYGLTITLLWLDVLYLVIVCVMPITMDGGLPCCLHCLYTLNNVFLSCCRHCLYTLNNIFLSCCCPPRLDTTWDEERANDDFIYEMPMMTKYKFRRVGDTEDSSGGIMVECDTNVPIQHALSAADAECIICFCEYENGNELNVLQCHHHFHSVCIEKWLHTKPYCPLCRHTIQIYSDQSSDEK